MRGKCDSIYWWKENGYNIKGYAATHKTGPCTTTRILASTSYCRVGARPAEWHVVSSSWIFPTRDYAETCLCCTVNVKVRASGRTNGRVSGGSETRIRVRAGISMTTVSKRIRRDAAVTEIYVWCVCLYHLFTAMGVFYLISYDCTPYLLRLIFIGAAFCRFQVPT